MKVRSFWASLWLISLFAAFAVAPAWIQGESRNQQQRRAPLENPRSVVRNQEAAGSIPARSTNLLNDLGHLRGGLFRGVGRGGDGGCSPEIPFTPSPEPLARYAGTVWVSGAAGAVLSQDDGGRHDRGYRNRWRYTITGVPSVQIPSGCAERLVTVRALAGGLVTVDLDQVRLVILPGDPEAQGRISAAAPTCESNRQLVHVGEISGRWVITIEEPNWLPWTRERC